MIGATIMYGSSTIARLEPGQTATLHCRGKKMTADLRVQFVRNGSITYGQIVTRVDDTKTATLPCAGKKMSYDVIIKIYKEEFS